MAIEVSSSRDKILTAGTQHLLEDGIAILERGLSVQDVVTRADVSQKTFYATFLGKKGFVDALLLSLNANPERVTDSLSEVIQRQLIEASGDLRRIVRAVCAWDLEQVIQDPGTLLQLAVLVLGRQHRGAVRKLRQAYAAYDDAGKRAYEAILERWGASLRAPFTHESVAVVLTALVEGLAIRRLADPTAVAPSLFGDTVIALVGSIVDTGQNHEHIDDAVSGLATEVMAMYEAATTDVLPDDPRDAILNAARLEFGSRGYFATKLSDIAANAAVTLPALRQLFRSKAMIVTEALRPTMEKLRNQTEADRRLQRTMTDTAARFVTRLAKICEENREFVGALLAVVAHDTAASPETAVHIKKELDIPGILAPVLRDGQGDNVIVADLDAYDAAAMIVNSLLLRSFSRRDDSVDIHTDMVMSVLFRGLLTRDNHGSPTER